MSFSRYESGAFAHIAGAQDVVIKQGKGALLTLIVNVSGLTISIYDNVSGTINPIALLTTAGPGRYEYNVRFQNGLHVVTTGTGDFTFSYV